MTSALVTSAPPLTRLFRVAYGPDSFAARLWQHVHDDGTFGNRFDDPSGQPDLLARREVVAPVRRFRVIYCATPRAGVFAETITRFRPSPQLWLGLQRIADDEPVDASLLGGVVPASWRLQRLVGGTDIRQTLRFVDVMAPETRAQLTRALAPLLDRLEVTDLDLSAMMNKDLRRFSQEVARHIYEQVDETGIPRFAGSRYLSRHNPEWELWAIYHDRLRHTRHPSKSIFPDDSGLVEACRRLGLAPPPAF